MGRVLSVERRGSVRILHGRLIGVVSVQGRGVLLWKGWGTMSSGLYSGNVRVGILESCNYDSKRFIS